MTVDGDDQREHNKEYEHITTQAIVDKLVAGEGVFQALLREVKELSRKKPDATMSLSKITLINRVLTDFLEFLREEPEGKYLDLLKEEDALQISDALLMMVQFESALSRFRARYTKKIGYTSYWVTNENIDNWREADIEFDID